MTLPEWRIRPGRDSDGPLLAGFRCADRAHPWQAEVENFIQKQLFD
ncbi:hypothetical protein [Catenuloplanes indicus]|uniref:Uncharacterized protein n=1 Tax=Catenuloplanes indicus TaxID=137267 RepID=A0AAE4AWY1_9ACTN|nr:hypothetical protein [Catenuloplanes indicus]MDQ0365191.1 hypothetical protein [Catenuloplanes indicus]